MEIFKRVTHIDFIGRRRLWLGVSMFLNALTLAALFVYGLNFGLDFTGGTLVEITYSRPVDVAEARKALADHGMGDAVVQRFGTGRDVMVPLPLRAGEDSARGSVKVIEALRAAVGEREVESRPGQAQKCLARESKTPAPCPAHVKRVEFVGPQVGRELAEKGGLALLFSAIGILFYVIFRFEWRFAAGAIAATAHDVFLVFGFFSFTQIEFSLSVLAAFMAVL